MSDDLEGSAIIVPKVLVLECSYEAVIDRENDMSLQCLVGFVPDAEQEDIGILHAV